jgi:hypothetical protein
MKNIIETPEQFAWFNLARLRGALRLEIAGMKGRGPSALSQLRAMGYRGSREKVLAAVHRDLEARKMETKKD